MRSRTLAALLVLAPVPAWTGPDIVAPGREGSLDGVMTWVLPDTANGLHPTQSWHATGSTPDGDVYVAGMDHATNAALYRLPRGSETLRLVGDARSASEAAGNWQFGETAEKFHTRPTWLAGRVYVATMDHSGLDEGFRDRRGFHWYAYDVAKDRFIDLSAAEPRGVGTPHGNLVTLAADPDRGFVYGAGVPKGMICRLDVAGLRTDDLGRPDAYDTPYVYTGRFMWLDTRGRLYFTSGNPRQDASGEAAHGHVHFLDPVLGMGELKDWRLREPRAIETGRCAPDRSWCVVADNRGHVYRFTDDGPRWSYVGQVATESADDFLWMFQVTADGRTAYVAASSYRPGAAPASLSAFDLASGSTRRLCGLADLDPALGRVNVHTGYDAWDDRGRFYFASFVDDGAVPSPVTLTRVDPARLEEALDRRKAGALRSP